MQSRLINLVKKIALLTIIVSGFLALLLVFNACEDDYDPQGALSGSVYSVIDSTIIENATVSNLSRDYSTSTDSTGSYIIHEIPEGLYTIQAEAEGFRTGYAYAVEIWVNDVTVRNFYLAPE